MRIRIALAALAAAVFAIVAGPAPAFAVLTSGFAVVDPDGTAARKHNVKSVTHLGTGRYNVAFRADVSACAFAAITGGSAQIGTTPPAFITLAGASGHVRSVHVRTFDSTGSLTDLGFHLTVTC